MAKKSDMVSNAAVGALTNQAGNAEDTSSHVYPQHPNPHPFQAAANKMKNSTVQNPEFTGMAFSVICTKNQGFNNFQVATLHIEKGKVMSMDLSDKWVNFETIAVLDHCCHLAMIHLNNTFADGKAFEP